MHVRPERTAGYRMHRMVEMVVIVPVDGDVDEGEHVGEEGRNERRERRQLGSVRHLQLEHHDRDDHRDHAVAERFEPAFAHVYLRFLKQFIVWSSTMPTACM